MGIYFLIMFSSCTNENIKDNLLPVIDIEANISNMKTVNLSRFTDDIRYVPLANINNYYVTSVVDMLGNYILARGMRYCLLYDSEGHFILKIADQGRGPGEYPVFSNAGITYNDNIKKIFISSVFDLHEYNIDGSYINKYSKSLLIHDKHYIKDWLIINDTLFFGNIPNGTGQVEYKAMIFSKYGKVIYNYKNFDLFRAESIEDKAWEGDTQIVKFRGIVYFKEQFNDTLFSLNEKYELIPEYIFNMGDYKLPLSIRAKKIMGEIIRDYIYISDIYQTENHFLLICDFGNRFPAKRLSLTTALPGALQWWYNTTAVLGLYDKKTGELVFCKPTSTDNPLYTSGMYNDIDAGPKFLPKKQVNDSVLIMWVRAKELKDHVASDDFKHGEAKYPEKKKELEELADRLTVFDNPVLMLVTFRK